MESQAARSHGNAMCTIRTLGAAVPSRNTYTWAANKSMSCKLDVPVLFICLVAGKKQRRGGGGGGGGELKDKSEICRMRNFLGGVGGGGWWERL